MLKKEVKMKMWSKEIRDYKQKQLENKGFFELKKNGKTKKPRFISAIARNKSTNNYMALTVAWLHSFWRV